MNRNIDDTQAQEIIAGRNPVLEAIKAGREIDAIFVAKGNKTGSIVPIISLAREKSMVVKEAHTAKLDALSGGAVHQGIVAIPCVASYSSVEEILSLAEQKNEKPFILIADEIEDPHNLGALIRTAEAAGVHGLIIPKRRSASLTSIVYKTSAGAVNHLKVARVSNLASEIEKLKSKGIWIYGLDMQGESWENTDFSGAAALVVGSEGRGIGRLIREKCDIIVSLPMYGKINSLNASVAGGIVMYDIARRRLNQKP